LPIFLLDRLFFFPILFPSKSHTDHFQAREGGSTLYLVSRGLVRLYSDYRFYAILIPTTTEPGKGARDQNQAVGQALGQAFDHRLDPDEKTGAFRLSVF
jgi:hypothetical protein